MNEKLERDNSDLAKQVATLQLTVEKYEEVEQELSDKEVRIVYVNYTSWAKYMINETWHTHKTMKLTNCDAWLQKSNFTLKDYGALTVLEEYLKKCKLLADVDPKTE